MSKIREACPICGSKNEDNWRLLEYHADDSKRPSPFESYIVYRCSQCGFCYAGDIEETQTLGDYYQEASRYDPPETEDIINEVDEETAGYINNVILRRNTDATVLDVGCGAGGLLLALEKLGYHEVYGIDPAPTEEREASVRVYQGRIEDDIPSLRGEKFDLITTQGVLEHTVNLEGFILALIDHMKMGGYLLVDVPDCEWYTPSENDKFNPEHVNYFSRSTIMPLFKRYNLRMHTCYQESMTGNIVALLSLG